VSERPHIAEPAETSDFHQGAMGGIGEHPAPTSKGKDDGDCRMAGDDWPEVN